MRGIAVLFFIASAYAVAAEPDPIARYQASAQLVVNAVNAADGIAIQYAFDDEMQKALPPEPATRLFSALLAQHGKLLRLSDPRLLASGEAIFSADFERGSLDLKLALDDVDHISGLWFLLQTAAVPVPEKNATALVPPFRGRWQVLWGGDTREFNHHRDTPNQRYAFDILGVDESSATHRGEGKANEDYFAFGRDILAPADGEVLEAIDGVRDNVPGSMNPYSALGNAVLIKHRADEISVLAHLKRGSLKVKAGDKVLRGQVIGACGNSGNSSEPHLHYHLQNAETIQDGVGIKVFFERAAIYRNGKLLLPTAASPVKGDILVVE